MKSRPVPSSSSSSSTLHAPLFPDKDSGIVTEIESDKPHRLRPETYPVYPFSDDDDLPPIAPILQEPRTHVSSNTYLVHQAEQAIESIKQLVKEDAWKKALKHKNVMVYMLQKPSKGDKTTVFKGEAVIRGFSPQSVFYVIGMRRLYDPNFEEGRLIENLNDTTSLTYEAYRHNSSSKIHDVTVVEKIECTSDGVIIFACTSAESPNTPKANGRIRDQIKLQGWILKPLHTNPPSTKVTFITQESVRGWISGLTKKSLARRPLIIAAVDEYLQKKADRLRARTSNTTNTHTLTKRPSILKAQTFTSSHLQVPSQRSPTLGPSGTVLRQRQNNSILTNPPPRQSSLQNRISPTISRSSSLAKRIKFADDLPPSRSSTPQSYSSCNAPSDDGREESGLTPVTSKRLYPPSRHRTARKQGMETLKRLATSDLADWKEIGEKNDVKLYSKSVQGSPLPILRGEGIIGNGWSPEQVCSVIQCFGSRQIWDEYFEAGSVVERFSQKEYLVYTQMRSIFPIQSRDFSLLTIIESDSVSGMIHVATTSVADSQIPETKPHIRGRLPVSGWVLRPIKNEDDKTIKIKTTFISHMDLAGTTPLPPAIVRLLSTEVPACVDRVQSYLREHGCPPYIRRVAGKITSERFDSEAKSYHISYTVKHTPSQQRNQLLWYTDVRTHPSMYGSGFDVVTEPADAVRVELRTDDMGLRIYSLGPEVDGRTVKVDITPKSTLCPPGSLPQFNWNGNPLRNPNGARASSLLTSPIVIEPAKDEVTKRRTYSLKLARDVGLHNLHETGTRSPTMVTTPEQRAISNLDGERLKRRKTATPAPTLASSFEKALCTTVVSATTATIAFTDTQPNVMMGTPYRNLSSSTANETHSFSSTGSSATESPSLPPSKNNQSSAAQEILADLQRGLHNGHPLSSNRSNITLTVGPLTPPHLTDNNTSPSFPDTPNPLPTPPSTSSKPKRSFDVSDVFHDRPYYMFVIELDLEGSIAALCYLPTRYQRIIQFFHTEIPIKYRNMGLGDILVGEGFRWSLESGYLVIPTCPFVQRHLQHRFQDRKSGSWKCVVFSEEEGLQRLLLENQEKEQKQK
ncbi:hypothetical protein EC973_001320 [Apophysomyces ossiformis]|uniref:START domain-containing protein n=1 Tax=Apophysomyces ossiformis TaxID=679940 RepID=A0A8H7ESQ4_9FUNG|nr:hypothetical protein EC973_001320 [Apophysomyces ossiformis]